MNKKGISEIISYVLLILIVLGVAAGVYAFLRSYVPSDVEECSEDTSVMISNYTCSSGGLNVTLVNTGFFSIDGAFVKIGEMGRVSKISLNCQNGLGSENCSLNFPMELKPNENVMLNFSYVEIGAKEIEIEPIIIGDSGVLICSRAIARRDVVCL